MTDAERDLVHDAVIAYMGRHCHGNLATRWNNILEVARDAVYNADDDELPVVAAMSGLGPEKHGSPPQHLVESLLSTLRTQVLDPAEMFGQVPVFATVFGCGAMRPPPPPHPTPWDDTWERAQGEAWSSIMPALAQAVQETSTWLRTLSGFPEAGYAPTVEDLKSNAHMLAGRMIHPFTPLQIAQERAFQVLSTHDNVEVRYEPEDYLWELRPGTKGVLSLRKQADVEVQKDGKQSERFSASENAVVRVTALDGRAELTLWTDDTREARLRPQILTLNVGDQMLIRGPVIVELWHCGCGHKDCACRHRLASWDPAICTLVSYLKSAVKGPQPRLQAGSFLDGMESAKLAQEGF